MSYLAWNARGLENPCAIRDLGRLLAERNPLLLFISETKLVASQCRSWTGKFSFNGNFAVDCCGRSGGLLLLWPEPLDITIISYSPGHIDCIIKEYTKEWRFTGFYGNPNASLRKF